MHTSDFLGYFAVTPKKKSIWDVDRTYDAYTKARIRAVILPQRLLKYVKRMRIFSRASICRYYLSILMHFNCAMTKQSLNSVTTSKSTRILHILLFGANKTWYRGNNFTYKFVSLSTPRNIRWFSKSKCQLNSNKFDNEIMRSLT